MRKAFVAVALLLTCAVCFAQGELVELRNPVIPGFNPDPSCVCVGEDYYLVTSTFHYFPGVPIYYSRDLQHWDQIGNVLDRPSQLPLDGANASLGIYAPTIRYNDGTFYMITTNVGNGGNFLVYATDPAGPWSEPVWLEQQGIDPSLYFEDGKCYMVSNPDANITLCEINPRTGATLKPGKVLWKGTGGRFPEGPHIYKHNGWYYLLISEGGIEMAHCLTVARSRNIYGPYEANPANPIFTHCSLAGQESNIQATGHGDIFQAADGSWWIVMLAYRRYGGDFHHIGRETFLAPVTWAGGWPVINDGEILSERMNVPLPSEPEENVYGTWEYDFSEIGPEWMHIQHPIEKNYSHSKGKLVLTGTGKGFEWGSVSPTALLRRQQSPTCVFGTKVKLTSKKGEAGLGIYQTHLGYIEFLVRRTGKKTEGVVRVRTRSVLHEEAVVSLKKPMANLLVLAYGDHYEFLLNGKLIAKVDTALLANEIAGGFCGVTIGPYCISGQAEYEVFTYEEN